MSGGAWAVVIGGCIAWFLFFQRAAQAQDDGSDTSTDAPPATDEQIRQIAIAIAYAEGYYRADGSINDGAKPVRCNNPGDITSGGEVRQFATIQDGWNALYHQISLILNGQSGVYSASWSIIQIASVWTNATGAELQGWAATVAQHLGVSVTDTLTGV